MKTLKAISIELILPFILAWFFSSAFIDIVAVPTVFKFTSNLEEAGKIGMTVFHRFNCFEIFFAVMILFGQVLKSPKSKMLLFLSVSLLGLALFYTFFMTPAIANAAIKMHQVAVTDPMYEVLRAEHGKYHHLYRYFDSAKLLSLLFYAGLMIRLNIKLKESV